MAIIEEMKKDILRLVTVLDSVMDDFFDSCGRRDQEVEDILEQMKDKYGDRK